MAFSLPDLPYAYDALEPVIDTRTMQIHHGKHHNTYVTKLNSAIEGLDVPDCANELIANLDQIPQDKQTAVRNNGGGHANHSLFWKIMAPKGQGGGKPEGELTQAIDSTFGSFENWKEEFTNAALGRFGSGWAWLTVDNNGKLCVCSTPNQDNPRMGSQFVDCPGIPILGIDVWEHAYYLQYQNRRADYVAAWFDVINWPQVAENYEKAKKAVAA